MSRDNSSHDPGLSKASTSKDGDTGDSFCMKRSSFIILALVALMAGIVGAATFVYTSSNQQDEFESKVSHSFSSLLRTYVDDRVRFLTVVLLCRFPGRNFVI